MRLLDEQAIEDIAVGAAVLGTGGGGDPFIGKLMALQAVAEHGPVRLIGIDEVPDDALVVPTAMMGAPTVIVEKIPSGKEILSSFDSLQSYLGRPVFATMPIEAGGVNSMIPIALAATLGLPMVDADGMGRAFPELQMVTFHLHGIAASPMMISDEKGNSVLFNTIDNVWTERLARAATVQMGGSAMDAIYPMTGEQLKRGSIPGIVTFTERIGQVLRLAKNAGADPVAAVLEVTEGVELFRGKVADIVRRTDGGFVRGLAEFAGMDDFAGQRLRLEFQNENLIARTDDAVLATTPDLIVVLDAETGRPITTEGMRYGARGVIVGIRCHEQWRTPMGIETVGPRYFGYDLDYVPLEDLVAGRDSAARSQANAGKEQ